MKLPKYQMSKNWAIGEEIQHDGEIASFDGKDLCIMILSIFGEINPNLRESA